MEPLGSHLFGWRVRGGGFWYSPRHPKARKTHRVQVSGSGQTMSYPKPQTLNPRPSRSTSDFRKATAIETSSTRNSWRPFNALRERFLGPYTPHIDAYMKRPSVHVIDVYRPLVQLAKEP